MSDETKLPAPEFARPELTVRPGPIVELQIIVEELQKQVRDLAKRLEELEAHVSWLK